MITEDVSVFVDGSVQCLEARFMGMGLGGFHKEEAGIGWVK